MATDATGSPTSLGIPKFNTTADSPSGLGGNAQMDAINALLVARDAATVTQDATIAANAAASVAADAAQDAVIATKATKPASSGVKVWNNGTGVWDAVTGTPDGTKFLRDDGSWQALASTTVGTEVAYTQVTSALGLSTTITDFIDSGTVAYLAVPYMIECFIPQVIGPASAAGLVQVWLYDGGTDLGCLAQFGNSAWGSGNFTPVGQIHAVRKYTPTAANHNFKIRIGMSAGSGSAGAGSGGAGQNMPAFIRITRAS